MIEEVLYPAMEARKLHLVVGKGPSARTLQLDLPPFTLDRRDDARKFIVPAAYVPVLVRPCGLAITTSAILRRSSIVPRNFEYCRIARSGYRSLQKRRAERRASRTGFFGGRAILRKCSETRRSMKRRPGRRLRCLKLTKWGLSRRTVGYS